MNSSLIIQTRFNSCEKIEPCLVESYVNETFDYFNIDIKEIDFSYDRTNKYLKYTQKSIEKFQQAYLNEKFKRVSFYSLNTSDFEPNSLLVVSLSFYNGFCKLNCIIDSALISNNQFSCFINLCKMMNKYFSISTCCAFWVPEQYCPLSFSQGILRKMIMPCEYKNIARWIKSYSAYLTIIGNYNYIYLIDKKIKDNIISLLNNSEYKIEDDCLFFSLNGIENIGDLILTNEYKKISKVLIEHNLLEKNEYIDFL